MAARSDFRVEHLLQTLTAHGVDFVVVGGIAATLLGSARDTFDLDICPATDQANLQSLSRALAELEARLRGVQDAVPFVPDDRTLTHVEVLTLETDYGHLDVLMRLTGCPPYERLRKHAQRMDLGSFSVMVASIDDLVAMKEAAGCGKDAIVVDELKAISRLREQLKVRE